MVAGLEIRDLCFSIADFQMGAIELVVEPGEYTVITGPNGAGKSLLMKLVCGLYRPDCGNILIDNRSVIDLPPWQREVGYVPQDGILFPNMSVAGNIAFGLKIRGIDSATSVAELERIADMLKVSHLLERMPEGLSGGERQRVSLARALIINPSLLLLDEPVSAIDEEARDGLCRDLRKMHEELQITTIHISHNSREMELVADRVVRMDDGVLKVPEESLGD